MACFVQPISVFLGILQKTVKVSTQPLLKWIGVGGFQYTFSWDIPGLFSISFEGQLKSKSGRKMRDSNAEKLVTFVRVRISSLWKIIVARMPSLRRPKCFYSKSFLVAFSERNLIWFDTSAVGPDDQLCFQYLAINSDENLPKSIHIVPKWVKNFPQNQINLK